MPRTSAKPAIEVIAGPAHSAKTARIIGAFREALERGREAVLILPTARAARSLRTALLLDGTFEFLGGPRILTFIQFAEEVLERHAPGIRPIEATVEDELLTHIITQLASEGRLAYHARVLNFRGFVRAVRAFIMELKRAETTPEMFARFAGRSGASDRDRELSAVYSRYQEMLGDRGLYDGEGRFWQAKLLVSEGKLGPFAGLAEIFLDGFYDFTPTQLGLIEVLAARGVKVTMSLPLEEDSTRRELFESAEATLEKLRERFAPTVQVLPAKDLTTPDLAWLAAKLFRAGTVGRAPAPDSVRLIETPGTVAEVREIAREIKRLHVEEAVPLEQVAVVFRTLTEYRDVVEQVFDEFGIPVNIGRGTRLSTTSVGQLFLEVLRVAAEGWHARAVMGLLKSNYVSGAPVGLGGDGLSPARFEELLIEAGIIRGRESWIRNLQALRERVESRMESAEADDDEVRRRTDPAELERKRRDLERAEESSRRLFRLFDRLENANTTRAVRDALLDVTRTLDVERGIIEA
ncbi:MAG TPA: UvrD-helicase domain-containing protein, partial [Planctomycetota bacterium]|nr:UvrD-helicase domain-containing protein [Planctomycetota bacterium]